MGGVASLTPTDFEFFRIQNVSWTFLPIYKARELSLPYYLFIIREIRDLVGLLFGFYDISTSIGFLMPNPFLYE